MCSRYSLTLPPEAVRSYFRYDNEAVFPPRYNIAPSQPVAIVRNTPTGGRKMALVRWGLIPGWVQDPRAFKMLINARAEPAAEKPSYRRAGGPMALAGIFENWLGADGSEIETMAILTVAANAAMSALHDRIPAIIAPEHFDTWLDCRPGTATDIVELLTPAPEDLIDIIEVSRALNDPRNEGPEVQEPAGTLTLL
jgi:putative SOS response-associated peptidase YedK